MLHLLFLNQQTVLPPPSHSLEPYTPYAQNKGKYSKTTESAHRAPDNSIPIKFSVQLPREKFSSNPKENIHNADMVYIKACLPDGWRAFKRHCKDPARKDVPVKMKRKRIYTTANTASLRWQLQLPSSSLHLHLPSLIIKASLTTSQSLHPNFPHPLVSSNSNSQPPRSHSPD